MNVPKSKYDLRLLSQKLIIAAAQVKTRGTKLDEMVVTLKKYHYKRLNEYTNPVY